MVRDCQNKILENNKELTKAMVKPETLHITLFAMNLNDKEELDL
jgi:hypothetical protein